MALAETFKRIVDSLPPDWTHLTVDLRLADETKYIEAATLLTQINAQPYSEHDWHFKLRAAHDFGAIGAHIEAEREDGDRDGIEQDAEMRQHEEHPEQLDQRRGAAEELDIGDGEPVERGRRIELGERRNDGADKRQGSAGGGDLKSHQRALEESRDELPELRE